jgi:hypothetical protein
VCSFTLHISRLPLIAYIRNHPGVIGQGSLVVIHTAPCMPVAIVRLRQDVSVRECKRYEEDQ